GHENLLEIGLNGPVFGLARSPGVLQGRNRGVFARFFGFRQGECYPPAASGQGGSPQVLAYAAGAAGATAAANLEKKSSAIFLAAPAIRRWASWARLPPICASPL